MRTDRSHVRERSVRGTAIAPQNHREVVVRTVGTVLAQRTTMSNKPIFSWVLVFACGCGSQSSSHGATDSGVSADADEAPRPSIDAGDGDARRSDVVASATPFLLEDFSTYTSTANFLANPNGFYDVSSDQNTQDIVLDQSVGYGTSTQSMRYDFADRTADVASRCEDYTRARALTLWPPYAGAPGPGRPHVWVDLWMKFSKNFTVSAPASWDCASGAAYKLHAGGVFGPDKGRFMIQQGATAWTVELPDNSALFGPDNIQGPVVKGRALLPQDLSDDQWHRWRYEMKISSAPDVADGVFNGWLDDQVWFRSGPQVVNRSMIWAIGLGANMNQGPAELQSLWYGRIALYSTDPGW